ncbi:MAG: GNAT family N-acetyltransferase [Nitrospirae bacterium]|nr:MAG: GNAT family N-acetyltransferase [Nitrospirota bacterium]
MSQPDAYRFHYFPGPEAANVEGVVEGISYVFSHSFGTNPRNNEPYRLGPRTTKERLLSTSHVFVAQDTKNNFTGYLYAREIRAQNGTVGWIDSLAVLPDHRRRGIATRLVTQFLAVVSDDPWIGCATPNPIAALVIIRAVGGVPYLGECHPPQAIISIIEQIRPHCPDLRGADFNPSRLLVKTRFTPVRSEDTRDWRPPHPSEPPPWWASLRNLPQEHEALLIIDRKQNSHRNP